MPQALLTPEQQAEAKTLLAKLRCLADSAMARSILQSAALAICLDLEARTPEAEQWSTGILAEHLNYTHPLGEHLTATRRYFGLAL